MTYSRCKIHVGSDGLVLEGLSSSLNNSGKDKYAFVEYVAPQSPSKLSDDSCVFSLLESYVPGPDVESFLCYGVVGIIRFTSGPFLIVITSRREVGSIMEHAIYVLESIAMVPLNRDGALQILNREKMLHDKNISDDDNNSELDEDETNPPDENTQESKSPIQSNMFRNLNQRFSDLGRGFAKFLKPLKDTLIRNFSDEFMMQEILTLLCSGNMYFSYSYDLTNSTQQQKQSSSTMSPDLNNDASQQQRWALWNHEFWWNESLQIELLGSKMNSWILALISRRSRNRAGLRYERRGADDEGYCANYVETEQIVIFEKQIVSLVQVRGSIPMLWSQLPTSLKPIPIVHKSESENVQVMQRHFDHLKKIYPSIVAINLVDHHGKENELGKLFGKLIEKLDKDTSIGYFAFDFHKECRGMKFENTLLLLDKLKEYIDKFNVYFWVEQSGNGDKVFCKQETVFRTNCMDCLDRTNVVQSSIARYILAAQMIRFGVNIEVDGGDEREEDIEFNNVFNHMWANNGDSISFAYTGTDALKGDFTRTRKRNLQGVINDGVNSLSRFYLNNFRDSIFQVAIDFFLGKINLTQYEEKIRERSSSTSNNLKNSASISGTSQGALAGDGAKDKGEPSEDDLDLSKLHASAIENCRILICRDDETFISGWALPCSSTQVIASAEVPASWTGFKEDIFLLTGEACYSCRYHHYLERIIHFQRFPIDDIVSIERGPISIKGHVNGNGNDNDIDKGTQDKLYGMMFHFKNVPKGRVDPGTFMNRRLSTPNLFENLAEGEEKSDDLKSKTIGSSNTRKQSGKASVFALPAAAQTRKQPIMAAKPFQCWVSADPQILDEIIQKVTDLLRSDNIVHIKESIELTPSTENLQSTVSRIQSNLKRLISINLTTRRRNK